MVQAGRLLVVSLCLGLVEVAVEAVLGDAKELAGALARFGDKEGAAAVEVSDSANALVLVMRAAGLPTYCSHSRSRSSSRSPMFLVMGSGSVYPLSPVPVSASSERSNAFMSVMSKLMPIMPTGLPASSRM